MATDNEREIEEERRLAYVAMTRARNFLYVTWPLRYYQRWSSFTDKHLYSQVSRFITDDVRASCTLASFGTSGYAGDEVGYMGDGGDIVGRVRNQLNSKWD
jgi:ATP-dependent exoDNAse (exonuclease V) beta subunit